MVLEKKREKCSAFKFGIYGVVIGIILFILNLFNIGFLTSMIGFLLSPLFLLYNFSLNLLTTVFTEAVAVFIVYFAFLVIEGFIVGILIGLLNCKLRK